MINQSECVCTSIKCEKCTYCKHVKSQRSSMAQFDNAILCLNSERVSKKNVFVCCNTGYKKGKIWDITTVCMTTFNFLLLLLLVISQFVSFLSLTLSIGRCLWLCCVPLLIAAFPASQRACWVSASHGLAPITMVTFSLLGLFLLANTE